MVRNYTGGKKSKNISQRSAKKIMNIPEPDFINSFFAMVTTKPNGIMCVVKIIGDQHIASLKAKGIPCEIQANISRIRKDKRNNRIENGSVVQIEMNYEMRRANGNIFCYVICTYTNKDIAFFKKQQLIDIDIDTTGHGNMGDLEFDYEEEKSDNDMDMSPKSEESEEGEIDIDDL